MSQPAEQPAVSEDDFVLKRVILSAPGKVILHGEHAVVYGKSAIATSVDLRCYLLLVPNSSGTVTLTLPDMKLCQSWQLSDVTELLSVTEDEHLEAIKSFCKAGSEPSMQSLACIILLYLLTRILKDKLRIISGLEVFIASQIPFGAGLGSSAAYSVCIAGGLMVASGRVPAHYTSVSNGEVDVPLPIPLSDRVRELGIRGGLCSHPRLPDIVLNEINKLGLEAEKLVHGTPSGIDNSISTFGGAIEFKGGVFNQIAKMPSLTVLLVYTKVSRSTKKMVSTVRQKYNSYPQVITPVLDSIDAIVTSCKSTLEELWELERGCAPSDEGHAPLNRMQLYQTLQELISVNHHLLNAVGVGHASLDRAFHIAHDNGLMCKTTGAGGGGCALVLVPPDTSDDVITKVIKEIHSVGFECWKTQVGSRGVALHHCS